MSEFRYWYEKRITRDGSIHTVFCYTLDDKTLKTLENAYKNTETQNKQNKNESVDKHYIL